MKYYLPEHGQTAEDAQDVPNVTDSIPDSYAAAHAAEHYHRYRDGWEASWPLTIILIDEKGTETIWEVEREMVPEFYAVRKDQP